jgi:hypothetical protein
MIDQRIGKAKPSGQQIEKTTLCTGVGIDRKPRSSEHLHLLHLGYSGSDNGIHVDRLVELGVKKCHGIVAKARQFELVMNPGTLGIINMTVGARAAAIITRTSESAKSASTAAGSAEKSDSAGGAIRSGSALCGLNRSLACLVVLPGLVTEPGYCRHATNLER